MSELAYRLGGLVGLERESSRSRVATRGGAVPARIMIPRLLFGAVVLGLVLFGLLMIYSASSIVGLTSEKYGYDPAYFLTRQAGFALVGLVACVALARIDYHTWCEKLLRAVWAATLLLLLVVYVPQAGAEAYGATRWIMLGSFTLQPSEFAKVTIVLVGARIAERYFGEGTLDTAEAAKLAVAGVCVPLILILMQPDKGTTGVVLVTLLVMGYLSGVPGRKIAVIAALGLAVATAYALKDEYSRERILTMFDPMSDAYDAGYQLVQGFYALGSGGLGGVGLGLSRQKYNYLPMAHNDFIFAIIGEELGFVGAIGMLAAFGLLLWAGLKIAENAPDLRGRLIAAGCTSLLVIQCLLNVSGVVGAFPLSGKPIPFVSYGGSSVISCLMLAGLVLSVSFRSKLPETDYERRRATLRLARDEQSADAFGSRAGVPSPRSARRTATDGYGQAAHDVTPPVTSFRVIDGGTSRSAPATGASRATTVGTRLVSRVSNEGWVRVDLGPTASERLRGARRGR